MMPQLTMMPTMMLSASVKPVVYWLSGVSHGDPEL